MTAIVAAPTACPKCAGLREVISPSGQVWPCPRCCCVFCGEVSDTAPECLECFLIEDALQKRRTDR